MAERAATDPRPNRPPATDPVEASYLQQAVEEAFRHEPAHQQTEAMLAWFALLPRPMPDSLDRLAKPNQPMTRRLATLLRRAEQPAVRRALVLLATVAPLREAAEAGLQASAERGQLGPILAGYHLLSWRPVWRVLRGQSEPPRLWPKHEHRQNLESQELRGLPAWASTLRLNAEQTVNWLAPLASAEDAATRLFHLRRLINLARQGHESIALPAIAGFCHDPEPPLARMALTFILRRDYPHRAKLLGELLNSPHPTVRAMANRQFAPLGFARLWSSWPQLEPARRQAAARALWKIDPNLLSHIQQKLEKGQHDDRLRALSMIGELNQGEAFETTLTALTRDPDEVIASAAAKALGSAKTEQAAQSLQQVLDHRNSRVRANAVEALNQLNSARHLHELAAMAQNDENRPRANAIQSLLNMQTGEAMTALAQMLGDERADHRRSALWVVETMGVVEVARQISELAASDPDAEVRARAARTARQLLAQWDEKHLQSIG
jgi:HEAT repeat protein